MNANMCQPTMVQHKCESHHLFWQVTYKIPQVSLCSGLAMRTWCVIMNNTCSKLNTTLKIQPTVNVTTKNFLMLVYLASL